MHAPDRIHFIPRTFARLFLVAGLVIASLPGCRTKAGRTATPQVEITIAYPTNISPALALIALDKGYFTHRGARVTPVPFETGKDALNLLLEGKADVAVAAETPIARGILANGRFKILAAIEQSGRDVCIVARRDRGILAPMDLKGKVIGYRPGTSAHYFLDSFLLANRLGPKDVRLVDLTPLQARVALVEGTVDAVVAWDPHAGFLAQALGERATVLRDEFIYTQIFCVIASQEFIRDHPGQVKAILEGLISAKGLLSRSPAEAHASIATFSRVDATLVARAMPNHEFDVRLDQSLIVSLGDECRWLMDSGTGPLRGSPDLPLLGYFHLPGLLEIDPRRVQVIRTQGSEPR